MTSSEYVLYARKSTESEDRQALSIDAQLNELKEFASRNSLRIIKTYTESRSAKKSGRPVFGKMLSDLKANPVSGILCWKLDRLSRNLADAAILSEAMDDGLFQEIKTPGQTYKNTSTDRFMSGMEWLVGRKYVDDLSENVKRGIRAKVQEGWFPGQAPLGYLNDRNHPQGQRKIIKDPDKFELVRILWKLMDTGRYSVPMIQEVANNKLGLTTRTSKYPGGRPLSLSGLYRIFTNIFYCGLFSYNGEVYEGMHPPMVSIETYDRVQAHLGGKSKPRPKSRRFTFTGLMQCASCGGTVTAEEKFKHIKATGERRRYIYYHCTHKKKKPCAERSITERELKRQINDFLLQIQLPKEFLDFARKHLKELELTELRTAQRAQATIKQELGSVQRRLKNLLDLKISPENESGSLLSNEEYTIRKRELLKRQTSLEVSLSRQKENPVKVTNEVLDVFDFAGSAAERFREASPELQRDIFCGISQNRRLSGGKLLIIAKNPFKRIARSAASILPDSNRIEPDNMPFNPAVKRTQLSENFKWCALVNDVRTAVRRSLQV